MLDSSFFLENVGLLVLRLALAAVFIYHAMPKLKNPSAVAQGMKWPSPLVSLLGFVELMAGVFVALGIYTQLNALILGIVMLGALYHKLAIWKTPFSGQNGWELDLMLFASALTIFGAGGGDWVLYF